MVRVEWYEHDGEATVSVGRCKSMDEIVVTKVARDGCPEVAIAKALREALLALRKEEGVNACESCGEDCEPVEGTPLCQECFAVACEIIYDPASDDLTLRKVREMVQRRVELRRKSSRKEEA